MAERHAPGKPVGNCNGGWVVRLFCLGDEIGEQAWLTQVDLAIAQFSMTTALPGPCAYSKPSRFSATHRSWA
jgi:hypothetical protein